MDQRFRPSSLVLAGLMVDRVAIEADRVVVRTQSRLDCGTCPSCGTASRRIQSRYWRRASDLPISGRRVELLIFVRRFRCDAVLCGRQIFAERFADGILAPRTRRTDGSTMSSSISAWPWEAALGPCKPISEAFTASRSSMLAR
jgi:hypothetical protein